MSKRFLNIGLKITGTEKQLRLKLFSPLDVFPTFCCVTAENVIQHPIEGKENRINVSQCKKKKNKQNLNFK